MKSTFLPRLAFCICGFFASVTALAASAPANVHVHYNHPQQFTEARHSFGMHRLRADDYLAPLKAYIAERASRILAPGQQLNIEVTDVDLAGEYEPWRGPQLSDVRVVRDIYPPRIDLNFTLNGADGKVLRQGSRKLRDPAFLSRSGPTDQGSLRYEKSLIDSWLRKGTDKL